MKRYHALTNEQRARGASKGTAQQALGCSLGGFSTLFYLGTERGGEPITLLLSAGERHAKSVFTALLDQGAASAPGGGAHISQGIQPGRRIVHVQPGSNVATRDVG